MRKIVGIVGVVGVFALIIISVRGNEEAKLREIIARAIKAHGGADKLEKYKTSTFKAKGKMLDLDYSAETAMQLPDCSRTEAESQARQVPANSQRRPRMAQTRRPEPRVRQGRGGRDARAAQRHLHRPFGGAKRQGI